MRAHSALFWSILTAALLLLSLEARASSGTLHADEFVQEGNFYTSHPTAVRVIRTDSRYHAVRPEVLLRVSMEQIVPNRSGVRTHHLFFSQSHVSEYIEAIDQFVRLSRDPSQQQRLPLARIPSWETFHTQRDLVFEFLPPQRQTLESTQPSSPLLLIQLAYDNDHRGGSFYFTPANADALLQLLFDFIHVIE